MAKDQLSQDLEELLNRYQKKISDLQLNVPDLETPAAPEREAPAEALQPPPPAAAPEKKTPVQALPFSRKPAGSLAAALLALLGLWLWQGRGAQPFHRSYPLPFADAGGLAAKDGTIFAVDRVRQLLFSFRDEDGQVKGVRVFSNASLDGLTWGEGYFWSSDAGPGKIYQHNNDANHTVRQTFANPNQAPTALYWDGWHLWARDFNNETFSQYSLGDTLNPVREYSLGGVSAGGFYVSQNVLWLCERFRHKVIRYRLGEELGAQDAADLEPWLAAKSVVKGCAVTPSALWLVTINPAELHRFELQGLPWKRSP